MPYIQSSFFVKKQFGIERKHNPSNATNITIITITVELNFNLFILYTYQKYRGSNLGNLPKFVNLNYDNYNHFVEKLLFEH